MTTKKSAAQRPDIDLQVGRDDVPGGDVALYRSTEGISAFIPAAWQRRYRSRPEALEILALLQEQARIIEETRAVIDELAPAARRLGVSWDAIGWTLNLSANGARKRWADGEQ